MKHFAFYPVMALCLGAPLCVGCSEDTLNAKEKDVLELVSYPDSLSADSVDKAVFGVLNLDYPGLEKVKAQYAQGQYYYAACELLTYYRNRANVVNPHTDLMTPTITPAEQNMADQALQHRFYIRNFKESSVNGVDTYYSFDSNGKIDWETLAATMPDQEFRNQLHRHQWMPALAKAYRLSGDEKYLDAWKSAYQAWMAQYPNPQAKPSDKNVAWVGLQPTERVRDRMDFLPYFIQSTKFGAGWLTTVLKAFNDEVETIRRGYYGDGSNIKLSQAKSVATAGLLMPEFKKSEEWLKEGAAVVSQELSNQFNADGVQNELDPSYHIAAISDFHAMYRMVQANSRLDVFSPSYTSRMKDAVKFVCDLIFPNYSLDNFNDTRNSSYTKSVILKNLRLYADMYPDDAELRWLATEGRQGMMPKRLVSTYATSGYYMLRNGWKVDATMMVLKNNANPNNKWHCQPDNGTFCIYRKGRNFFPDAGVYSYGGTAESNMMRNSYAATKMHNTMTDLSAVIKKGYMNGKMLKCEQQGNAQLLVTENQSYARLTHRRAVFFVENRFFVIVDEGYGDGNKDKINLNFHLATGTGAETTVVDDLSAQHVYGAHTAFGDNNNMLIRTFAETTQDFVCTKLTSPYSNKLGEVNGDRIGYQYTIRKPERGAARFVTVICPFGAVSDFGKQKIEARFTDNTKETVGTFHAGGASVEVSVNGKVYQLTYTL
uniref:Heparinase II/III family protein n=1 Tax=Prevotella sp. GTC17262 TaxID=3236797 RepID=A0AB33JN85_9BACT